MLAKRGIERPSSLFHDLVVRFDRPAAGQITTLVRDLDIAYVHELVGVSFHSSVFHRTSHVHVHCIGGSTQTRLSGFLLLLFLCISYIWGNLFLHHNSRVNSFVCVLILRNLDVLGLLVDLLLGDLLLGDWFRLSALSS